MQCAWQAYLNLLPHWMRSEVDKYGKDDLLELRVRSGYQPDMILRQGNVLLTRRADPADIAFIINSASEYSPWAAGTIAKGYLTAPGGHRIGICGAATVSGGKMTGITQPTSLCIRVARDFTGIARSAELGHEVEIVLPAVGEHVQQPQAILGFIL